jgi:hypothetical protein
MEALCEEIATKLIQLSPVFVLEIGPIDLFLGLLQHDSVKQRIDISVCSVYNAYMTNIQYTIRNIPPAVDQVIRKRSKQTGKSFNQTVVDLLTLQTFGTPNPQLDDSFSWLYGKNTLDNSFDDTIKKLSAVDEKLWQ